MRPISLTALTLIASTLSPLTAGAKGKTATKTPPPAESSVAAEKPTPEPAPSEPAPAPVVETTPSEEPKPVEAAGATPVSSDSSKLPAIAFIEAGFRFDLGTFSEKNVVGRNQNSQNGDVSTFDPLLTLGALLPIGGSWRMGAALTYGFNYADPSEENGTLGQLLILDGRVEWNTQVTNELGLFAAPRVGLIGLIPGGRLAAQISENQLHQFDTWNVPRIGFLLGADAGARYKLHRLVNVRASVGYSYNMLFLMDSGASAEGISASQNWQIQASRLGGALGVEVMF